MNRTKIYNVLYFFDQDEINYDEGQQQQDILDPNSESVKITTQKSNVNINTYQYI